ncbi:tetratricopeptide repeat protein [Occallatibacter riparius]|uniref:Sel1 repeat family protein n=1 Tax=Occallatibacter riparius TaxID=1002689 RepID=A0A9J7BL43_9BACT|nr:tetratricopeptide repeat protein [Occallatibacter riparius]UWZ83359.1 sel1 repeat family protein [Occallatibacter riparius]
MGILFRSIASRVLLVFAAVTIFLQSVPAGASSDKHFDQLRKRAEKGDPTQQLELAEAYLTGAGVKQDMAQAAHWYEQAARRGNPQAENQIGFFYQAGIGVPVDPVRAFHWYQLASASGLVWGKVNLGVAYLNGIGTPRNASAARHLFEEALEKGNGLAADYLGHIDYIGLDGPPDIGAAEKWFAQGAKLHDPIAAYDLGLLYSECDDHARDLRKAAEWFRSSADKGYAPAQHALGRLLVNEPELSESPQEARMLLEEASSVGIWKSSAVLGVLARGGGGFGEASDVARAYYWFTLSELQGGEIAKQTVDRDLRALRGMLSESEQTRVAAEAQKWFAQHPKPIVFLSGADRADHLRMTAVMGASARAGSGE